jgi:hypothetical protein
VSEKQMPHNGIENRHLKSDTRYSPLSTHTRKTGILTYSVAHLCHLLEFYVITLSACASYSDDDSMTDELETFGRKRSGLIHVLSLYLPGGDSENRENCGHDIRYPTLG